jgi:hypothetical protein
MPEGFYAFTNQGRERERERERESERMKYRYIPIYVTNFKLIYNERLKNPQS